MNYTNYVEINVENLRFNIDYLKSEYKFSYYVFDVSSNAYGHGMYMVNYVRDLVDYLYCLNFSDVQLIRKYDKEIPIIYGGLVSSENIYDLVMMDAIIVIRNKNSIEEFLEMNIKDSLKFMVEIDVSGYRGIESEEEIESVLELSKSKNLEFLGVIATVLEKEYEDFKRIVAPIKDAKLWILNSEKDKNKIKVSNAIRFDYSIYGINYGKKKIFKKDFKRPLKQVLTLNSKIEKIKEDKTKKKEEILAVIPIGYLQGMVSEINKVYINDKLYKVKEIREEYSIIIVDGEVSLGDIVQVIGVDNPLECYLEKNILEYISVFGGNLPILYEDYALEKTFVY